MNTPQRRRQLADHFFPFLKKRQRVGWQGVLDAALSRVGPVTRSAPLRRVIQAVCMLLFLYAFVYICWPYSEHFDESTLRDKEAYPVELFLLIDPLVGVSTVIAGRFVNFPTLLWTIGILLFCILIPRAFCGYFCPLGTMIDLFDWLIGRRLRRFHLPENGPKGTWVHFKYYLLSAILISSLFGVLISGFAAAIPVLTRGLLFTAGRMQLAWLKGSSQVPAADWTLFVSVCLFGTVFLLSLLGRRFWCRYVCPSGALLSVFNFLRIGERKVEDTCIHCNKCVEICPFDAIHEDFTTRGADCTYCQTCGGVCPTHAIKFVTRWNTDQLKREDDPPIELRPVSRRSFLAASVLGASAAAATRAAQGDPAGSVPDPIRPPGSVPEESFLDLCIRCGQCFAVCPGPVLKPAGMEHGFESLWTPVVDPDHAGCHQDCNHCTQVCPTGAIQPLDLMLKRKTHIGLAKIDLQTCWPYRSENRAECDLCYVECEQAGYHAIEMREIPIELDPPPPEGLFSDLELEEMARILAPHVNSDACVGCGICQYRCYTRFVVQDQTMTESAIVVAAENEDRMFEFSDATVGSRERKGEG